MENIVRKNYFYGRIITAIVILFLLFNCKFLKKAKHEYKDFDYIYAIEFDQNNIGFAKTKLETRVTDLIAGYTLGIKYEIKDGVIKTYIGGNISKVDKESKIEIKEINNNTFMIEKGNYKYKVPLVDKYSSKYNISVTNKGNNFWKTYNNLIISTIKKNKSKNQKGMIIPLGDLRVVINPDGTIKISEKFEVYVF